MAAAAEYESVLCVKPEVHVYRVPPRASNRGYRAAEWQLEQPVWSGRMRITARGRLACIRLEDRSSGELFAQAPVEHFPSAAVESVTDSSRYFVVRVEDESGRRAFVGVGFGDRGDAFDFNVALQDHFKWVKQQSELARQAQNPDQGPKLDLRFKEGETIKLNIANVKRKEGSAGSRERAGGPGGPTLLPPPPRGKTAPLLSHPLPGEQPLSHPTALPSAGASQADASISWPQQSQSSTAEAAADIWGDFAKASGNWLKSPPPPSVCLGFHAGLSQARRRRTQAGSSSDPDAASKATWGRVSLFLWLGPKRPEEEEEEEEEEEPPFPAPSPPFWGRSSFCGAQNL